MLPGSYRNRAYIQKLDPRLAEAFDDVMQASNRIAQQTTASADRQSPTPAPPKIQAINVSAAQGIYDVQLVDNSDIYRGIEYFLEYSTTASFNAPVVIHLGTARNWRRFLGNLTLYWRAYSQYPCSAPSEPVYCGAQNAPTPVQGGGSIQGPVPQASTGSGTATSDGLQGGAGYGKHPWRPPLSGPPTVG